MVRLSLRLVAVALLTAAFLSPTYSETRQIDQHAKTTTTVLSLGWPSSPWWSYEKTTINGELAGFASGVKLRSFSWLFALAAVPLFWSWQRARRSLATSST